MLLTQDGKRVHVRCTGAHAMCNHLGSHVCHSACCLRYSRIAIVARGLFRLQLAKPKV